MVTKISESRSGERGPATVAKPMPTASTPDRRTTSAEENPRHADVESQASTSSIHPRVYTILIAFTAWFALAVWSFAGKGITDYLLFIVSGFIFVAVALPLILSRVGHDRRAPTRDENAPSLRDWAKWKYETLVGKVSGAEAAAQILLPIAAAAVGMTAIGIVFYFSAGAGS